MKTSKILRKRISLKHLSVSHDSSLLFDNLSLAKKVCDVHYARQYMTHGMIHVQWSVERFSTNQNP